MKKLLMAAAAITLMINELEPPYYSYADFNIDLPDLLNLK